MRDRNRTPALRAVALAVLVAIGVGAAPVVQAVTLKEAAQQAVLNNPEVLARWHTYRAATENIDVAKGAYLPKVDLNASVGRERRDTPLREDTYTRSGLSLFLTQKLFDGFATRSEVAKFNYAQRVRFFELLDITETTALEAMRAYTDVLRYRKLHALAQENYVQHRAVFEQIQQRVQSGVGRRVDLEQASGRLALAESNLLTEASNLHDVSARYQRIVGSLPPEDMAEIPSLEAGIPDAADQGLRLAHSQNPGLAAAQENIVASQNDARLRHSNFLPKVDLRARHDLGRNLDGIDGNHELTYLELLLNYNLYNGGADKAEERQYWEQVDVAKDLRDKTCRDVRQTYYIAYNDVKRLKEQLGYLQQHQLSIEKARDAYRKQFDIGQRTLLDLLDTENEVFEAKRAYQIASFDRLFALGRTHASMGNLLTAMGLKRLETAKLFEGGDKAAFDPDTVCPPASPFQSGVDKDKVFAEAMAAVSPTLLAVPTPGDSDGDGVTDDKDRCPGTPAGTRVDVEGCPLKDVVSLRGVNFEYNSYALRQDSFAILDEAVKMLQRYPDIEVEVAGHTDYHNTIAFNQILSERRARTVLDYLVSHGVSAKRLTSRGYSELQPIADNTTEEGQAKNRRVELRVRKK